jgi:DNA invertase Pin-like site-specific DNA recombinase
VKRKVAVYARIWTPDEDLSAQVCYLRQHARQRGLEVIAEYEDIASGPKARHPGLEALIADAKQGRFSVVLTNRLACLSKSIKHLLQLTEHFRTLHIDLISIQEAIDTSTSTGKLFFDAMASLNQCEGELVKEHIRVGLRRRKLEGFQLGRRPLSTPHDLIVRDRLSGMSLTQCSKKYCVSRASVVRFVRLAQEANAVLGNLSLAAQREVPAATCVA